MRLNARRWWPRNAGIVGPLFYYDLARLAQRGRTTQLRCLYLAILALADSMALALARFPTSVSGLAGNATPLSCSSATAIAHSAVLLVLCLQTGALLLLTPAYIRQRFYGGQGAQNAALPVRHHPPRSRVSPGQALRPAGVVGDRLAGRVARHESLPGLRASRLFFHFCRRRRLGSRVLSMGSVSILCSILCPNTLAAVLSSYGLVVAMNLFCFGLPAVSPLTFITSCENQVENEWKTWEQEVADTLKLYQPGSGTFVPARWGTLAPVRPTVIPKPKSAEIRIWSPCPLRRCAWVDLFVLCRPLGGHRA